MAPQSMEQRKNSPMSPQIEDNGGETIVVKAESENRPLDANPPSPIHDSQRLESPEPSSGSDEDIPAGVEKLHPQIPSGTGSKSGSTTMESRLQNMVEVRPLPWRPGVVDGADVETGGESRRKQIRFGCLLATRGEIQEPGCSSCVNGRGKVLLIPLVDAGGLRPSPSDWEPKNSWEISIVGSIFGIFLPVAVSSIVPSASTDSTLVQHVHST